MKGKQKRLERGGGTPSRTGALFFNRGGKDDKLESHVEAEYVRAEAQYATVGGTRERAMWGGGGNWKKISQKAHVPFNFPRGSTGKAKKKKFVKGL